MALLKRELHRQVKGPEITHADRCTLVFDTDTKRLYVESEVAHFEAKVGGTVKYQTTTMDIADYLKSDFIGLSFAVGLNSRVISSLVGQSRRRSQYKPVHR
jgi:hypothetical protein